MTKALGKFLLMAVIPLVVSACPTWFYEFEGKCHCGTLQAHRNLCNPEEGTVAVIIDLCVTFDYSTQAVSAGSCPYGYTDTSNITSRVYKVLPKDPTHLNETMCKPFNRGGLFCGSCIEGFGPGVYSDDLRCANCSEISLGRAIAKYAILQFVPITLFFFMTIILHINITSGPMLGYFIYCQGIAFAAKNARYTYDSILSNLPFHYVVMTRISIVIADFWNLQFFRSVLPPFCLSENISTIHVIMMSFMSGIYPVLLMITVYITIQLHAKTPAVQYILKPITMCTSKFPNSPSAGDSLIHAFATFIMLSSSTLFFSCFNLFSHSDTYYPNNTFSGRILYSDPSIPPLSTEHILCLTIAIVVCFVLAIIPAFILCLYPTRIYEKLSRCVAYRKRLVVTTFAEVLNSSFKDGLNGTRDYRMITGIIILIYPLFGLVATILNKFFPTPTAVIEALIAASISLVVAYIRPGKSLIMNMSLSVHMMFLSLVFISYELWRTDFIFSTEKLAVMFSLLSVLPHVLLITWIGFRIAKKLNASCRHNLKEICSVIKRAVVRHKYKKIDNLLRVT